MECKDCFYYWQNADDDFPKCHFVKVYNDDPEAPCEIEDEEAYADIDRREREWLDEHEGYQE